MHPLASDDTPETLTQPLHPVESMCTRLGCAHIFRLEGRNPLGELAKMVKIHSKGCRGLDAKWTTRSCATSWKPSIGMIKSFPQADCHGKMHSGPEHRLNATVRNASEEWKTPVKLRTIASSRWDMERKFGEFEFAPTDDDISGCNPPAPYAGALDAGTKTAGRNTRGYDDKLGADFVRTFQSVTTMEYTHDKRSQNAPQQKDQSGGQATENSLKFRGELRRLLIQDSTEMHDKEASNAMRETQATPQHSNQLNGHETAQPLPFTGEFASRNTRAVIEEYTEACRMGDVSPPMRGISIVPERSDQRSGYATDESLASLSKHVALNRRDLIEASRMDDLDAPPPMREDDPAYNSKGRSKDDASSELTDHSSSRATSEMSTSAAPKRQKKTALTEAERRAVLEGDPWTAVVEADYVVCKGCTKVIMLDKRSRYYPGLWKKHRNGRCPGINKGENPQGVDLVLGILEKQASKAVKGRSSGWGGVSKGSRGKPY